MQRNKKSILNAMAAVLQTLSNGLLAMVSVKFVLVYFGSDFNGLNSTANQLVSVLMLLEGGFTVATNVALFKPYGEQDYTRVNAIIAATKNTFQKIGAAALFVGVLLSVGYSFVINTGLSRPLVFAVFLMTILPVCFNFYYATKYRILLQAEQKEYVISLITFATSSLGHIINLVAMSLGCGMWQVRFNTMLFSLLNSLCIGLFVKRKFKHIDYYAAPDYGAIKGTKDVFIQKLAGAFYSAAPIVCITFTAGGTMLASVYAVYNSVFVLLKGVLHAVIDAPRLGFGEVASSGEKEKVWRLFEQYELIVGILLFVFVTTAATLIVPFISVYTHDVKDVDYYKPLIAVLLSLICYFELLHIPSGHLMNMTGRFKHSRDIQMIAIGVMLAGFVISLLCNYGIYGILFTILLTAFSLCIMEIGFIHSRYFEKKLLAFFKMNIPLFVLGVLCVLLELKCMPPIKGYLGVFAAAIVVFLINFFVALGISWLINREGMREIWKKVYVFLKR